MKKQTFLSSLIIGCLTIVMISCQQEKPTEHTPVTRDQVFNAMLHNIRLGDGVPLGLQISVRWRIKDLVKFSQQFASPGKYDTLILKPRQQELISNVANTYPSVDSIFTVHRQKFMDHVKSTLLANLGEEGVEIKEVIMAEIGFPPSFIQAKEEVGLKEQELERIRQKSIVDMESAEAARKKAEADGQVAIKQAQVAGELQKIKAKTEESNRLSELARAETQAKVAELNAKSEAKKQIMLAEADLKKRKDLKNLDVQKQRELEQIQVDKQKQLDQLAMDQQLELAKICNENPTYAAFLVNKELASKVEIAVLPTGMDANVFGNLLNHKMTAKK